MTTFKEYVAKHYPNDTAVNDDWSESELIDIYPDLHKAFLNDVKFTQLELHSWDDSLSVLEENGEYFICISSGKEFIHDQKKISRKLYKQLIKELEYSNE